MPHWDAMTLEELMKIQAAFPEEHWVRGETSNMARGTGGRWIIYVRIGDGGYWRASGVGKRFDLDELLAAMKAHAA